FPDILTVQGKYQHKPPLPFTPGTEAAGDVIAVGAGVTNVKVGDRVICGGLGGYAEEMQVPSVSLRMIPNGVGYAEAASFTVAYLTAYVALVRRAKLEADEWLLVHGAAGGVGLACVDLAKVLGCRVIAASASDAKLQVIADEYAPDAVVNVTGGFRERVKELTGGRGADVVYDPVGGDVFDESVRCIAFNGRLLVVGFTSGRIPSISVNMPLIKGFSVMGVRAGEYGRQFPERGRENAAAIWAMAAEGKLKPRVYKEYALGDWRSAFDSLADRQVIGKSVIVP
ncbi:MAG TPA: NADPH:quinone oxidoreductase family protein, partial [Caulobacteraceae bacterium]|nr:NADPH:quinone oxidoreductase family protein [Caulobacteraceae bacterium]